MVLACFPAACTRRRAHLLTTGYLPVRLEAEQAMPSLVLEIGIFAKLSLVFHARVPKWSCSDGYLLAMVAMLAMLHAG